MRVRRLGLGPRLGPGLWAKAGAKAGAKIGAKAGARARVTVAAVAARSTAPLAVACAAPTFSSVSLSAAAALVR